MMITEEEALNRLTAYCAGSEHCKWELQEKMQRWGISFDTIKRILTRLESEKYIDEERFCKAFTNDKFKFSKWGKLKISQALYLKKIPQPVITKYLDEIDQEEYLNVLANLINSKRKNIRAKDDFELNGKLIRFAMSRGFEFSDIKRCIAVCEYDD